MPPAARRTPLAPGRWPGAARVSQWRARWDAARVFLTADGESGKAGGNETIRVDQARRLRIKVPAAPAAQLGPHLDIAAPVWFAHRGTAWAHRVAGRRAVRYHITHHRPGTFGICTPPGNGMRSRRHPRSNGYRPAQSWVSISTPITSPAVGATDPGTRSGTR